MNKTTRIIRSEEITIDAHIFTVLAGGRNPGEIYFAAIAPDMELTIVKEEEMFNILPCFDGDDAYINLSGTSLLLVYNPVQVLKLAGKRHLTGPVVLMRISRLVWRWLGWRLLQGFPPPTASGIVQFWCSISTGLHSSCPARQSRRMPRYSVFSAAVNC